ncbi:helix-turn-helix domain-containing protein [Pantoea sp. 1.19]|uniref:helix-turn-helix domain-containing protein n=1 Tax=Pantoea sp. 1.19 TaxID=1925589 RepID=UPI000948AAAC|nr:XRE family transcriptional regulator [Pantoea sp. 1.19]
MNAVSARVAATLKQLRGERRWSLGDTAQFTGVSKAMLGQIERGESSPTVATLWKIATGFGVPFSQFIRLDVGPPQALPAAPQAMRVTPVFPWDATLGFEMLRLWLPPGARSESAPHAVGTVEHVLVESGTLWLTIDGTLRVLAAGEGERFAADVAHGYENRGAVPLKFHNIIHYPRGGRA